MQCGGGAGADQDQQKPGLIPIVGEIRQSFVEEFHHRLLTPTFFH